MDLTGKKPLVISFGMNGWYPVGVERLERSLIFNGYPGDIMTWKNELPEGCPHPNDYPYSFKPYCFEAAFKVGYKTVLWCDASLWNVANIMPIFDYIIEHGLYFFKSGYPLSATCTDKLLEYAGEKREDLVDVSEFATGLVGIHIDNPNGNKFFSEWMSYCKYGMFRGSRHHDENDSKHPLFKFSRQDQSAASMILHKMGIKTAGEDKDWVAYKSTNYNPELVKFFIEGL